MKMKVIRRIFDLPYDLIKQPDPSRHVVAVGTLKIGRIRAKVMARCGVWKDGNGMRRVAVIELSRLSGIDCGKGLAVDRRRPTGDSG